MVLSYWMHSLTYEHVSSVGDCYCAKFQVIPISGSSLTRARKLKQVLMVFVGRQTTTNKGKKGKAAYTWYSASCSESPPQKRSGMARVLNGSHSFTCTPSCVLRRQSDGLERAAWRPPRPVAQCRQFQEEAEDASVSECTWTLSALEALRNALYKL